jgi:hypothetical protein
MNEWVWSIGGMVVTGENSVEINLSQYRSVDHKSHVDWLGIESGPSRCVEASEPWHGQFKWLKCSKLY